jgi:hypothetical protein
MYSFDVHVQGFVSKHVASAAALGALVTNSRASVIVGDDNNNKAATTVAVAERRVLVMVVKVPVDMVFFLCFERRKVKERDCTKAVRILKYFFVCLGKTWGRGGFFVGI